MYSEVKSELAALLATRSSYPIRSGSAITQAVGLGTFRAQGDDARTAVLAALRAGLHHIDTASIYKVAQGQQGPCRAG